MATRPIFVPRDSGPLVSEVPIEFKWHPGMAPSQKKKNILELHKAAEIRGFNQLLEISSKSGNEIGRRLSAFNLEIKDNGEKIFMECAYQGSKVFRNGGPYTDLYYVTPREAKKDQRLKKSGELIGFDFKGKKFALSPKNAFYDWLYIKALFPHREWISKNIDYQGYTDIEFNPSKSINCQARAFAELIALSKRGELEKVDENFDYFANILPVV